MKCAALYIQGRVFTGRSHLDAWEQLSSQEKEGNITSGFFDTETREFLSDDAKDHFYNKKLLLIRHASPHCSDPQNADPDLSPFGIEQSIKISHCLKNRDLKNFRCFTSPLLRCLRTSQILSQHLDIHFSVNPDIMETTFSPKDEVIKNRHHEFPELSWEKCEDYSVRDETEMDFLKRVKRVLSQLPEKCILVTHHGVVQNMARLALSEEKISSIPPASVTFIDNQEVKCLGETLLSSE